MTRVAPLLPQFNAGEQSERMAMRVDLARHGAGVETMENMLPLPQGGAQRRPGSRFAAEVKTHGSKTRLKRFEFSTTQAYVIEFGAGYMRFFRNQGQIVAPQTSAVVENGTFDSGITQWTDLSTGGASIAHDSTNLRLNLVGASDDAVAWAEQQVSHDAAGVQLVVQFRVTGVQGDSIELRIGSDSGGSGIISDQSYSTGWHSVSFVPSNQDFYLQFRNTRAKTVGVDDIRILSAQAVEIDTPYTEAELFEVNGPQNADTLYLFHENHPTHKLVRNSHSDWSLIQVDWLDGPWLTANSDTDKTLTPAATTGLGVTVTAAGHSPFLTTDVGRLVRISNPSSGTAYGYGIIVSVQSAQEVTVDIRTDFSTTDATSTWQLGAWSESRGWPNTGSFFEQRLYAAGTIAQPQTFWASQSADVENMAPDDTTGTVTDTSALDYTIAAEEVNVIRWFSPGANLVMGTAGGEWTISSDGAVITPTDIAVIRRTTHGSARIQPVRIENGVLFAQRARRKIRDFSFSFEVDAFVAGDLTIEADHILRSGVVEMAYAQEPDGIVWCVREDGVLAALTYTPRQSVIGWSRHILGGSFGTGGTVVESVTTIPGADAGGQTQSSESRNEVWVVVKRTIQGQTRRYIEFLEKSYETGDRQADAFYVDSGLTLDASPVTEIGALGHLEGETVAVWGDGAIQPQRTVSNTFITADHSVSVAQIGLPYTHTLKTHKIDVGAARGTAIGRIKRYSTVTIAVLNSHIISIGPSSSSLQTIDFRKVSDAMDAAVPLFTGEREIEFEGGYDSDARIVITSSDPAPFTLLGMAPEMRTHEKP